MVFIVAGFNLFLILYGLIRLRGSRGGWSFIGLLSTTFLFAMGYALESSDLEPWRSMLWSQIQHFAVTAFPAFYLMLVLQATNVSLARLPKLRLVLFGIPVILFALHAQLNEHSLVHAKHIRNLYIHGYLTIALFRLLSQLGSSHRTHRIQTLLMLLASLAPWIMYLTDSITTLKPWSFDSAPFILTLTPFLFAFSIFSFRFLDFNPIARELVFDRMLEAILLIDHRLRIIDFNQAATRIFPELDRNMLGESVSLLYPHAEGLQQLVADCSDHGYELPETPLGHTYEAHIQGLVQHGTLLGRMLRFTDVSRQVELRRALERLATIDSLTGALNRRTLLESLSREIKRAARLRTPLAVLFLDLDFFKRINDTYGHNTGDEVLRVFARSIQKNMRDTDLFGRHGGEEFLFVLTGTTQEQALQVAEKVRSTVEAQKPLIEGKVIAFTTSIGITVYDSFETLLDGDLLINRADAALYQAKAKGRNRVECWENVNGES